MEQRNFVAILNCLLFVTLSFLSYASAQNQQVEQEILRKLIGDSYDNRLRPIGKGENISDPVYVRTNFFLRSIESIDDANMEYSIQITFRQQWNDGRLSFYKYNPPADLSYLTLLNVKQVWIPDTFFSNEKRSKLHDLMVPNNYIRIFPNGDIIYSTRLSMTLSCPMNFVRYPFDEQVCSIRMASYGYTNKDIHYLWKDTDPVQVTSQLHLREFSLTSYDTTTCDSQTNTGVYSCLLFNLKLQREYSYYQIQLYIPCVMLVLLSWCVFWLDPRSITARVILGVASLLVMAMQVTSFNKTIPRVSYTKAIDVWTGICLTFAFVSVLETMTVNFLTRIGYREVKGKKEQNQQGDDEDIPLNHITTDNEGGPGPDATKTTGTEGSSGINKYAKMYWAEFTTFSAKIDGLSRILFPLAFIVFNILYWLAYL